MGKMCSDTSKIDAKFRTYYRCKNYGKDGQNVWVKQASIFCASL